MLFCRGGSYCMLRLVGGYSQWFKQYDQLLSGYMRKDTGVGMDLTLVRMAASADYPVLSNTTLQRLMKCTVYVHQLVKHAAADAHDHQKACYGKMAAPVIQLTQDVRLSRDAVKGLPAPRCRGFSPG